MRKYIAVLLCAFSITLSAQKSVEPKRLEISYDKTLHLVFDNNVKYIDAAADIEAKIALNNIVRVKVVNEDFIGTRGLSVITSDGIFHSFELCYNKEVSQSSYYACKDSSIVTTINVAPDKSTHLIFPSRIIYSDIGNEEELTSEVTTSNNVLKVKSVNDNRILPSSLFVVTEDKKKYEFKLNSSSFAMTYTYNYCNSNNAAVFDNITNDKQLESIAEKCLSAKRKITSIGGKKNKLTCYLNNIHINNDILYFTFEIINSSYLNMNIDFIRCFIKDKKNLINSPEQEIESTPILNYKYLSVIDSNTSNTFVLAFPKFTIPDGKKFEVQLFDKDGGRHLYFSIRDNLIINAKPI